MQSGCRTAGRLSESRFEIFPFTFSLAGIRPADLNKSRPHSVLLLEMGAGFAAFCAPVPLQMGAELNLLSTGGSEETCGFGEALGVGRYWLFSR